MSAITSADWLPDGRAGSRAALLSTRCRLEGEPLAALRQVEARFKVLWANHGDDISNQYAGTGALKSGFTRTGKRTYGGLADDGVKSLTRYYLNNFFDGRKQDALDLITGTFTVDKSEHALYEWQQLGRCSRPFTHVALILAWIFASL